MKIRQTGQPIPVSKVETDRREEVKKIKPIGSQKIPDSFETGKSQSSDQQSNSSASVEPEKKAGQITGGILIKQMTQARLADSGIKLTNEVKENSGVRDFNDTQQGQAKATTPEVNTKGNPRTPGSMTDEYGARVPDGAYTGDARSNMEQRRGALEDFFAQQNIEASSSGVDASDFGVGQGVDLGGGFNGGQQGPGDPMDNVNDQFARRDYLDGLGNAGNRLTSQMQDAVQGSDGANMGHGTDMIADNPDSVRIIRNDDGGTTEIKTWNESHSLNWPFDEHYRQTSERKDKDGNTIEWSQHTLTKTWQGNTQESLVVTTQNKDGSSTTTKYRNIDGQYSSQTTTRTSGTSGSAGSSGTSGSAGTAGSSGNSGGTKTATDQTEENYVSPVAEKKRKWIDEMAKNLGMDGLWNIQHGPKNQGKGPDYGPEPVGTSIEDTGTGSLLSQFGKDGLVGNPNQQNHDGPGNSNFGGLPGETVTDPLEGETYHGATRNDEVNTSRQTGMKENVDEDDEEKRKLIINPDFKPATNFPRFKKL